MAAGHVSLQPTSIQVNPVSGSICNPIRIHCLLQRNNPHMPTSGLHWLLSFLLLLLLRQHYNDTRAIQCNSETILMELMTDLAIENTCNKAKYARKHVMFPASKSPALYARSKHGAFSSTVAAYLCALQRRLRSSACRSKLAHQ